MVATHGTDNYNNMNADQHKGTYNMYNWYMWAFIVLQYIFVFIPHRENNSIAGNIIMNLKIYFECPT